MPSPSPVSVLIGNPALTRQVAETITQSRTEIVFGACVLVAGAAVGVAGWMLTDIWLVGASLAAPLAVAGVYLSGSGVRQHHAASVAIRMAHECQAAAIRDEDEARRQAAGMRTVVKRETRRSVWLWWASGNPTSKEATMSKYRISQDVWQALRVEAVAAGLAEMYDGQGRGPQMRWLASAGDTLAKLNQE